MIIQHSDTKLYKGVVYFNSAYICERLQISKQRLHQIRAGYISPASMGSFDMQKTWNDDTRLILGTDYIKIRGRYYYNAEGIKKIKLRTCGKKRK